ncbi:MULTISPECIES: KTSC domain-containing protein [Chryseobacterium]|uniref:KTSC domain-containing protein n=1 Tax=Chryseobacterium sp. R2A-55 TaxID=2744445 RepID=UPI001F17F9CE|nr:KTSC domain-containing protein [Chryseobacterium sp. R2A-55]
MPSNVVKKYSYNTEQMILTIMFVSGKVYDYFQVPLYTFENFRSAFSKGSFLNRFIKGKFRYKERLIV